MASEPTITGVRSIQITYSGQPVTPFAGVTVTDPTPGATDTVDIGVFPGGASLDDGVGFNGLRPQPSNGTPSHVGAYYMLQGSAQQVTAELDALVSNPSAAGNPAQVTLYFGATSSSGASSADDVITVDNSSVKPNGQGIIGIERSYQTIYLQPYDVALNHREGNNRFVFSPGDEFSVVRGFKLGGTDHDTLQLSGADFGNSVAAVLRNTGDVNGSAFITDPKTGDAIRLAGVTTAELKAHPKDFSFG